MQNHPGGRKIVLLLRQPILWGKYFPCPRKILNKNDIINFGTTENNLAALNQLKLDKNDFAAFAYTVCEPLRTTRNKELKIPGHVPTTISYLPLYNLDKQISVINTQKRQEQHGEIKINSLMDNRALLNRVMMKPVPTHRNQL